MPAAADSRISPPQRAEIGGDVRTAGRGVDGFCVTFPSPKRILVVYVISRIPFSARGHYGPLSKEKAFPKQDAMRIEAMLDISWSASSGSYATAIGGGKARREDEQ
jgi:hypothetical protein